MTKRSSKAVGSLIFLLFIGGAVLLPAFHRERCAGKHATHEDTTCPICQLATTPTIATTPAVAPLVESLVFDKAVLQVATFPAIFLRDRTQARAPPVA